MMILNFSQRRYGWKSLKKLTPPMFLAGAALLGCQSAMAGITCSNGSFGSAIVFNMPSPISIVRDRVGVTAITGWVSSNIVSGTCSYQAEGSALRFGASVAVTAPAMEAFSETLDGFKIYKTSVPNIGVQINKLIYLGPCLDTRGFVDYERTSTANYTAPYIYGYGCWATGPNLNQPFYAQFRARYVQVGPATSGTVSGQTVGSTTLVRTTQGIATGSSMTLPYSAVPGVSPSTVTLGSVQISAPTCTVTVNDVQLKKVKKEQFSSATIVENTPFQFNLSGCPAGLNNFQYRIAPLTTVVDAANGVFANTAGTGMAQGIGLRLTNSTGTTAIRLDGTTYAVPGYSVAAGGSTTIPMYVSYFRTGTFAQVQPGKVLGTAQLTLIYQ